MTSNETKLYNADDLDKCINRIEVLGFNQVSASLTATCYGSDSPQSITVDGVKFTFFNAGHVLGACMVLIEIAGIEVLYTGDYSCEDDRHLMAARPPKQATPDVLIVEATYGVEVRFQHPSFILSEGLLAWWLPGAGSVFLSAQELAVPHN